MLGGTSIAAYHGTNKIKSPHYIDFTSTNYTGDEEETNNDITKRCGRALARAGASITVTSMTDLVAFGISSSSSLPALASFCAYAAISIFFLWLFASTFFTATLVFDERRQRDNRRECLCCLTRKNPLPEEDDEDNEDGQVFEEDRVSKYFRYYHAPAILSNIGKAIILFIFTGLFAFGIWVSFFYAFSHALALCFTFVLSLD